MDTDIDILLTTYNGERFLREQIDSILAQTETGWKLTLRDDGSTDGTLEIIRQYVRDHHGRITLMNDNEHVGACQSFSRLLEQSTAEHMMLCDQDDIWLPEKIACSLRKMKELEVQSGNDVPLLVHTDLRIVNGELGIIADSKWRFEGIDPARGNRLNKLLQRNVVTGSSAMINRSLRNLAIPISDEAIMHDWWLALVTAAFGSFGEISKSMLLYRQHTDNAIGANPVSFLSEITSILGAEHRKAVKEESQLMLYKYISQASAFLNRYRTILSKDQTELLEVFIHLGSYDVLTRKYYIIKHRLFYNNPLITLGMLLFKWKSD
jgi:glycosyltransferase involved in cell wall biosynthesis